MEQFSVPFFAFFICGISCFDIEVSGIPLSVCRSCVCRNVYLLFAGFNFYIGAYRHHCPLPHCGGAKFTLPYSNAVFASIRPLQCIQYGCNSLSSALLSPAHACGLDKCPALHCAPAFGFFFGTNGHEVQKLVELPPSSCQGMQWWSVSYVCEVVVVFWRSKTTLDPSRPNFFF